MENEIWSNEIGVNSIWVWFHWDLSGISFGEISGGHVSI